MQIVLYLGWFGTTRALFAALSCLRDLLEVPRPIGVQELETLAVAATVVAGTMPVRTRVGGIRSRFCGLFARPTKTQAIMLREEEAARQLPTRRTMKRITPLGVFSY